MLKRKDTTFSIGDASRITGVSQKKLRSWEGKCIPEPERIICGDRAYRRYTPEQIDLITRIKEYRARHNLTQDHLAQLVGVRRETIVFLEQGKYNPSLKLAHDVAKALRTTIEQLFIFE